VEAPSSIDGADALNLKVADIDAIVDYLCHVSARHEAFFLWRPTLRDPGDEFILELGVGSRCDAIVTHSVRDFDQARRFAIQVVTPSEGLKKVRHQP